MEFIRPISWADALITSTTAVDTGTDLWDIGDPYVLDDVVRLDTTHKEYVCIEANTGFSPDVTPLKWQLKGATNSRKCFDRYWSTQTVGASPLVIVITPGVIADSMALLNLTGLSVNVSVEVPGMGVLFDEDYDLQTEEGVYDWLTYFTAPWLTKSDVLVLGLPAYDTNIITITLTGAGTVGIGGVVIGNMTYLGDLLYNPTVGIVDYSKKETDEFGQTGVTERAYAKRFTARFCVQNGQVDRVSSVLASVRSIPVVWIGNGSSYSSLIVWGFYKDWEIDIATPIESFCNITIEGVT